MVTRVLVTGGAGFIGSHVVDLLLDRGIEVTVLDALAPEAHAMRPNYLKENDVRYLFEDVRDSASVERALRGCDGVAHLAGKVGLGVDLGDMPDYVSHNVSGMAALLDAMRSVAFDGPTVLASSMVVYGEGRYRCSDHGIVMPPPRRVEDLDAGLFEPRCPICGAVLAAEAVPETAPMDPRNVYAATKLHQEHLLAAWVRETGHDAAAFRYHNVYGPRMPRDTPYAGVASIFRSQLESGMPPQVFEDGQQQRDFIHVADVATATVAPFFDAPTTSGADRALSAWNVGSGDPHTVGQMATALAHALAGPEPIVTGNYRLGDVRHVFAATDKLLATGWTPQVSFSVGMERFAFDELRASSSGS